MLIWFECNRAMGFKPGDSLGKQDSPPNKHSAGFAKASFAPATKTVPSSSTSSAVDPSTTSAINETRRMNEPIKFEMRTGVSLCLLPPSLPSTQTHVFRLFPQAALVSVYHKRVNHEFTHPLRLARISEEEDKDTMKLIRRLYLHSTNSSVTFVRRSIRNERLEFSNLVDVLSRNWIEDEGLNLIQCGWIRMN